MQPAAICHSDSHRSVSLVLYMFVPHDVCVETGTSLNATCLPEAKSVNRAQEHTEEQKLDHFIKYNMF